MAVVGLVETMTLLMVLLALLILAVAETGMLVAPLLTVVLESLLLDTQFKEI
jgi:hypothetical protein